MKHLSLACLLLMAISSAGQHIQQEPYDFPIKPGSDEWRKFQSGMEMVQACQLPQDIMRKLSTEALARTCLSYPLIGNIYAYEDLQTGLRRIIAEFNGLQELLLRDDAGSELMKFYSEMKPSNLNQNWSLLEKGEFSFDFLTIEMLLAQNEIINTLSKEQRKQLVSDGLNKFKEKEVLIETFGGHGLTTSAFLIAKVLDIERALDGKPAELGAGETTRESFEVFLNHAVPLNENVILDVITNAQSYINQ